VPADDDFDPRDEFPEHPPTPGHTRRWVVLALLLLAIAGGALAWYNSRPEMRTVPDLAGMEEGVALNAVAGDFTGVLAQESSETVDSGHVIRTDPDVGVEVQKGTSLTLFVSTGPAPRVLPEVAGKTVAAATDELEGLGLTVEVGEPQVDEKVPVDTVLSWTVPDSPTLVAGGTVTKGTAVRLVASAGPAPRTVPDLTKTTLADATKALTALQLTIAQGPDEFNDTIAAGQVVRQDPAPGATLDRDGTVTVILSKGHTPITMPTSLGVPLKKDPIAAALKKLGFGAVTVTGDPSGKYLGLTVDGQPARAGQQFPWGSPIVIVFAPTPPPASTP
jgi:serine/threonine-protein kinase